MSKKLEDYVVTIPDFPEPGIMFRDITSVIHDPNGLKLAVDGLAGLLEDVDFDLVIGPESRGFIFGVPVAYLRGKGFVFYELWAAAFLACLVLVMTRVAFGNRLLAFFGRHVFSIFMLQRIPMLVFSRFGLQQHRYVFVLLCFFVTLLLAAAFDRVLSLLPLFRPRRDASADSP